MRAIRSHFENIFVNAPIGIITLDLTYRITDVNPAGARMHRIGDLKSVRGASFLDLLDARDAEVKYMLELILKEEENRNIIPYTLVDGTNGKPPRHIEATTTLLRDDGYLPIGLLLMCTDVTEKLLLEERVKKSEKLALIGQLTVTLQHKINNPLQTISGNAEMLMNALSSDEKSQARVRAILDAEERVRRFVSAVGGLNHLDTVSYQTGIDMLDVD